MRRINFGWIIFCLTFSVIFLWRGLFLDINIFRFLELGIGIILFFFGSNEINKINSQNTKKKKSK